MPLVAIYERMVITARGTNCNMSHLSNRENLMISNHYRAAFV